MLGRFLPACGSSDVSTGAQNSNSTSGTEGSSGTSQTTGGEVSDVTVEPGGSCATSIPDETDGPYPAHNAASIDVLTLDGVVRSDIRSSINAGAYTGTATVTGVPLTIQFTLAKAGTCAALSGYALYIWHCDAAGLYSMYSSGVTKETYLRGVQQADENGIVKFTTIVPGCYEGRYPHIHFDVFASVAKATDKSNVLKTSQMTFPAGMLTATYATSDYSASVAPFSRVSIASDSVFSDGDTTQVANFSGDVTNGYQAAMIIGV